MEEFQIQDNQLIRYLGHAQNVIIPKGISLIGPEAFRDCSEITSVVVPEGVTHLGDAVFYELYQLE